MPKMKSNSGAKKRFRVTASGRIKCKRAYRSHILTKKSTKRKRHLRKRSMINSADEPQVRCLLPYL